MESSSVRTRVDGAMLLDDIVALIKRYIIISYAGAVAAAMWVIHTHAFEAADYTPYLFIKSATRRCGKSHLLDLLAFLVPRPIMTTDTTMAALFRSIAEQKPAVFFDEQDGLARDSRDASEDKRKILNAGFERGRPVRRCLGQGTRQTVVCFDVFCPKSLASIGDLPDTVADRSITIELKRKGRDEDVERFHRLKVEPLASPLRDGAATWASQNLDLLRGAEPHLPAELDDRGQDIAEPLLAIADIVGGKWPQAAREAIIELRGTDAQEDGDIRTRLLAAIRALYEEGGDWLRSEELVAGLTADPSSPWREYSRGNPITPTALARQLGHFGIRPQKHQHPGAPQARGYWRRQFEDAWNRYLPPSPGSTCPPVQDDSPAHPEVDTWTGPEAGAEIAQPVKPNPFLKKRDEGGGVGSKSGGDEEDADTRPTA